MNNMRQIGLAGAMYVGETGRYPGCLSVNFGIYYVWPVRYLAYMGNNRAAFSCPAALKESAWDFNVNTTLGATDETGAFDKYGISEKARFSLGYNDWGMSIGANPQLGLGGDINGGLYKGPVKEAQVQSPTQMIMIADVPAIQNAALINFNANLDVTDDTFAHSQRPANRHNYKTDILFADGHVESPKRNTVIDPAPANPWRNRWNNDNLPHNEYSWNVNAALSGVLDK
jgi:prepilin-type processing-associated H-X9-DG protein